MTHKITIIGSGASGLVAAICLARQGHKVTILESKPRIGQKILVTGNGRCNLTNLDIRLDNYHSNTLDIVHNIITRYDNRDVINFFKTMGLFTRNKGNLVYPLSNKAASVVNILRAALVKYGVTIITDFVVKDVDKYPNGYVIKSVNNDQIKTEKLIIATGLKAHTGTDIGLKILSKFGHRINKVYPALVQLRSDDPFVKGLKGIKFEGEIRVRRGGDILRTERGEILFTDYGVSGIAVMQVSYLFSLYNDCMLELDFLPDMSLQEVIKNLVYVDEYYKHSPTQIEEYLTGFIDSKLGVRITKHTRSTNPIDIAQTIKSLPIKITSHNGYKNAQVCGGGAALEDFTRALESKHTTNLYAIGEILDAVGDCGGYNLHWAFACALCVADGIRISS